MNDHAPPSNGSGLASAVELARAVQPSPDDQPMTGDLFGALPADPDGAGELELPAGPRGRGRPPGSRNRSTDEWARFLLTRYRSPLIGLAEIAQATPAELQAALAVEGKPDEGVTLPEALRLIMQAAATLAPYLHQKQPTAIDAGGAGMLTLIIQKGDGGGVGEGARIIPADAEDAEEVEENQGFMISDSEGSER